MNKSFITNFLAASLTFVGYYFNHSILFNIGLFAFSGAVTNWLAVHMLFEKVPGLYGSGVIPNRFEEFKIGIKNLMMEQFFTNQNIDNFLNGNDSNNGDDLNHKDIKSKVNFTAILEKIDLSPAFDSLLKVIMESSFGSMLGMFGGKEALEPLKEPFINNMKISLVDISKQDYFLQLLKAEIEQPENLSEIKSKIALIIDNRLAELTPQLVKEIVQQMIKQHLGWLIVWGGFFGGLIGFLAASINIQ